VSLDAAQGGHAAGAGGDAVTDGAAGGIDFVTARRISAIFARDLNFATNDLTVRNAVSTLAHIVATQIGSDFDGDTFFDFTNNGGANVFNLGDGDTAIDGLVIVKLAGFDDNTVTDNILKLVTV
jgi:hypothetical protein